MVWRAIILAPPPSGLWRIARRRGLPVALRYHQQGQRGRITRETTIDKSFHGNKLSTGGIPTANVDRFRSAQQISTLAGPKSVTWTRINIAHAIDITCIKTVATGLLTLSTTEFACRVTSARPAALTRHQRKPDRPKSGRVVAMLLLRPMRLRLTRRYINAIESETRCL